MIERVKQDDVEIVRLKHGKASALDLELTTAIETAFGEIAESDTRAVVLTGSGSIFSAGVDLFRLLDEEHSYTARFIRALDSMFRTVFEFPKPLVTAINGHAIAGGCLLAISGDSRIMSEGKGRIGVPELFVGVPFPVYALEMLRLTMHPRTLEQFVYSGTSALPSEAVEAGLIDRTVAADELDAGALDEALRLAAIAPAAFSRAKRQLRGRASDAVSGMGADPDSDTIRIWSSDAARDAIRDYLERTVRK